MNTLTIFRLNRISLAIALCLSVQLSVADEATSDPIVIVVEGGVMKDAPFAPSTIDQETIELKRPATGASSTDRRNTGIKTFCRGLKTQRLSWSLI
jgi:hypothetical protein